MSTRKEIMRCTFSLSCDICHSDCERAEITGKRNRKIRNILTVCNKLFTLAQQYSPSGYADTVLVKAKQIIEKMEKEL